VKRYILAFVFLAAVCQAADLTVTVKAVNMETGASADENGGRTYTWHSMMVEVDGTTYKIAKRYRFRETWLHKGTYAGRWKDAKRQTLEVDVPDGSKIKRVDFQVLGEE
jgi:hypothetical protein